MSFTFEYECNKCYVRRSNHELDSMACECGGAFEVLDRIGEFVPFDPYYDPRHKTEIRSWKQREKEMSKPSESHPEGHYSVRDDKKFMAECRHLHRHREEWKEARYPGYKAGRKGYDTKKADHTDRIGSRAFFFPK